MALELVRKQLKEKTSTELATALALAPNIRTLEGTGTTTLISSDNRWQMFSLSANRTCILPSVGIGAGDTIRIDCFSGMTTNAILTIQSSNAQNLTIANGCNSAGQLTRGHIILIALLSNPTTPAHWKITECNDEGIYIPAVTNQNNLGSIGVGDFHWYRVMNKVHVVGNFNATPVSGSSINDADITLPIASNVTNDNHIMGVATGNGDPGNGASTGAYGSGRVFGVIAGRAYMRCTQPSAGGPRNFVVSFMYILR